MNFRKACLAIFTLLIACCLLVGVAHAGTAVSLSNVSAGANSNYNSGQCPTGSCVYIYWSGITPSDGTVDITVYNPDGTVNAQWADLAPDASGTIMFTPEQVGTYLIVFDGYPTYHLATYQIAAVSYFNLPESSIGALATVISAFTAFGALAVVRKRNPKKVA
jgi:hypothetical protein